MKSFQLDHCLDSKRFVRDCLAEGQCRVLRLPKELRDAEDPELLRSVMLRDGPLLTFDRSLPHDHSSAIPPTHPGILVISNFPAGQTMTIKIAQRILSSFKLSFVQWHEVDWNNSIVEITTIGIDVWHLADLQLVRDAYLPYDSADWPGDLSRLLRQNAHLVS